MIHDMDSIEKYMLQIILHQQETQQLLNQRKLLQTQEDQSNTVQALKVNSVAIQYTCSWKENSNSETALNRSVKDYNLDSEIKDVHAIKYNMSKSKERCMTYFCSLHSHLQVLSKEDLKGTLIEHGFKRAFMSLFGQDDDTFTTFWGVNIQFQKFIDSQFSLDYDSQMTNEYFVEYTGIEVKQFKDMLLQHMGNVKKYVAERTRHQKQYDRKDKIRSARYSNKSGNDTDANDTDIRPIYDEEPMAEVGLTTLESGQHGHILNETSNKAKIKKEIDAYDTINIELEHSVAKLLTENEHLNKQIETIKKHYKDLYDSIKITRSKTIEQTTSLLANNADLKDQIQEKVFAIAALKNELRKLKGNSVDTKFAKTSVLGKPVLQSLINQSVVRQPNAFKSERPQILKPRFTSQASVKNDLSKPITQHYLPKRRESVFVKPKHMIASRSSRNSSKNMPRFSSNDMVHNHYLDEARKKTQERDRNSKSSVMHSARLQSTEDGIKPKPRSTNQTTRNWLTSKSSCVTITAVPKADHFKDPSSFSDSKHFVCSACHKCAFNANHDACITKFLKEVNSRAKIQSYKTRNTNKLVEQKSHT
ncbi:hypothetical protein Tco_1212835 [Tanacetum coccineum]